jgi:hypothetical protein
MQEAVRRLGERLHEVRRREKYDTLETGDEFGKDAIAPRGDGCKSLPILPDCCSPIRYPAIRALC